MQNKLNLDIQSILDKQFHIDFKGYDPAEVDHFIDLMIEDYQSYQGIIETMNQKQTELERNNAALRAKLIELEGKLRTKETELSAAAVGQGNVDVLKRISRLEEQVLSITNKIAAA